MLIEDCHQLVDLLNSGIPGVVDVDGNGQLAICTDDCRRRFRRKLSGENVLQPIVEAVRVVVRIVSQPPAGLFGDCGIVGNRRAPLRGRTDCRFVAVEGRQSFHENCC